MEGIVALALLLLLSISLWLLGRSGSSLRKLRDDATRQAWDVDDDRP